MTEGCIAAQLQYLQRLDCYQYEQPFQLFVPVKPESADQRMNNLEFKGQDTQIADIRGRHETFTLDMHGFQFANWPTRLPVSSFENRGTVTEQYLREIESLLRTVDPSIDRVFFFDWRLRSSDTPEDSPQIDMNDLASWLRPAQRVHVDQSPKAVLHRIQLQLGEDADFLLRGRVRIVNAWRPLGHAVEDYPLAVCEATSMRDTDLVACDHIRRKFKGQTMYAHFNPEQKWYYLSQQKSDEVLLMKMFDSLPSTKAKRQWLFQRPLIHNMAEAIAGCPHAAFKHPNSSSESLPRRSVEARALVFNYPRGLSPREQHQAREIPPETSD